MQSEAKSSRGLRYWRLLFLLTALLLLANVAVTFYSLSRVGRTYDALLHSMAMSMAVRTAYSGIQDVAISERGYLLRGDDVSLHIYRDSVHIVVDQMRQLDAGQSEMHSPLEISKLKSLLLRRLRIDSLDDVEIPASVMPRSREDWNASESRTLLQEIRAAVTTIEANNADQLAARQAAVASNERKIKRTIILVTVLGVLGMALMYRILRRSLLQQQQWETALLEQQQVLEDRVAERTASLQHYSLELQRSNRELEDFAFVASHDLQEPLRKILAFGDRLETRYGEALGDGKDYLDRMRSAATRMARLINDLLDFSRVTTKPGVFNEVNLDEVISEVLDDLEEAISARGSKLEIAPMPTIEADYTQMHQLFQNLIANAIKFVDEKSTPVVRITVDRIQPPPTDHELIVPASELLEIHVIDNGIGFDQEYAERIFKPFQRLVTRREYSGTGIGLALCRRIVERHGGKLSVTSAAGEGSDFTIVLPLTQELRSDVSATDSVAVLKPQELTTHER